MQIKSRFLRVDPENFQIQKVQGSTVDYIFKTGFTEYADMSESFFAYEDSLSAPNPGGGYRQKPALGAYTNGTPTTENNIIILNTGVNPQTSGARCYNHGAFLIDSFECKINNTNIEKIDSNYGLLDTYIKRRNSTLKNETLGSVMNLKENYLDRDADTVKAIRHDWIYKPDAPALFRHNVRQNSDVHIRIKFSDNFLKIIQTLPARVADTPAVPGGAPAIVNPVAHADRALYRYELHNFVLYVKLVDIDKAPPQAKIDDKAPHVVYVLDCYTADVRRLQNNLQSSLTSHTVSPTTSEIGYALQSSSAGDHSFFSPSVFISGPLSWLSNTNFTYYDRYLTKAFIKYQNRDYPFQPYENDAADKGKYHFYLSMMEKQHNGKLLEMESKIKKGEQSGSGLDLQKLSDLEVAKYNNSMGTESYDFFRKMGKFFNYDIIKKPEDTDTRLLVSLDFSNVPNTGDGLYGTNLIVFNKFQKICMVWYDNNSEIHKVEVTENHIKN